MTTTATTTRTRRLLTSALRIAVGVYLLLCIVARVAYPRLLFPAPQLERAPLLDRDALLLELPQADGSHTAALHYPSASATADVARTVVVFHGNGQTMFDDMPDALELKRRGFGVLLVEYRGYGTTYGPSPSESMLYEDGEAALSYLARKDVKPDQIVLWGWSLGTGVAAEMARRGHGSRVVLLAPFTSITDLGRRMAPILPVSLLMAHRFDTLAKAAEIKQPTLIVHGDADEVIPFTMGESVARAMPNAKLVRVMGGHHADLLWSPARNSPRAEELLDMITTHLTAK